MESQKKYRSDRKPLPDRMVFCNYMKDHSIKEAAEFFGVSKCLICGWCRVNEIPRRSFRYKDLPNDLTSRQSEIVLGSLLGDACLEKLDTTKSNSRFIEKHSMAQHDYLLWKQKELGPFSGKMNYGIESARRIGEANTHYCKFGTVKHPLFTRLEKEWYDENRVKRLPENLTITALALAVWYFDDGHLTTSKWPGIWFFTNAFTHAEVERLLNILYDNFGIKHCSIHYSARNRGSLPELFIKKSSVGRLLEVVSPLLPCQCLGYKLIPGGSL